jgi:diguanylate cyclase (GGDEF)-like protein/PAS domain S-box-containing protein
MNPIAERLTGWKSAAAIGRNVDEVFAVLGEVDDQPVPDPVAQCLASKAPFYLDADVLLVGRKGERRDIRCSAAPVRTPEGRVIGAVLVFQDVTQSRALQKKLAHSASHDPLTGLANRSAFEHALAVAVDSASAGARHALCFIDLDRFKPVNDTAGHAAGDELLRMVGETIRGVCRSGDLAARVGGDEFALLLRDCPLEHALAVGEKIVAAIEAIRFEWRGTRHLIGASIGVTEISARPSALGFIAEADAACYAAKAAGRGCVVAFSDCAGTLGPKAPTRKRRA